MLVIDFETASEVDLPSAGTSNYATHPSTHVLCMGWGYTENIGCSGIWTPGDSVPKAVLATINAGEPVAAWNASFDRAIWENADLPFPTPLTKQWVCLSAWARMHNLPAALDQCYRFIFGKYGKDPRGKMLIDLLCSPQPDGTWNRDPLLLSELMDYCEQDVRASIRCAIQFVRSPIPFPFSQYASSEEVNDCGVMIDRELAEAVIPLAGRVRKEVGEKLDELTDGKVNSPTQTVRIRDWFYERAPTWAREVMTVERNNQIKRTLDRGTRERLLDPSAAQKHDQPLSGTLRSVLELMEEGSNTSVAKFKRMVDLADPYTDRVYNAFLFYGAGQTGRFASRGLQLHNFRRATPDASTFSILRQQALAMAENMRDNFTIKGKVVPKLDTLASMLRPTLVAEPGNEFIIADWSAIEARVMPWLSYSERGRQRLEQFVQADQDPDKYDVYTMTARDLGTTDRQIGKVADLSLQFGGGVGAFSAMARNYGLQIPETKAERMVMRWRLSNLWATQYWSALEYAAAEAIMRPLQETNAGRVYYKFFPDLFGGTLVCALPDGSAICYPKARYSDAEGITAAKGNWLPRAGEKEWPRIRIWHGILAENVTQAVSAGVLRATIARLQERGYDVVAHVHDEPVIEVPKGVALRAIRDVLEVMQNGFDWTEGLPLHATAHISACYGK